MPMQLARQWGQIWEKVSCEENKGGGGLQPPIMPLHEPKKDGCAQCTGAH
jgi:hypothetical protein